MLNTLEEHYGYLSDRVKLERYQAAIERVVRPGHVVMDLGCGSGLLGLMALRAGAARVMFVEEGAIIEVARQTVTAAGFSDHAEFIRRNSFEVSLPDRVDVVLCDHVGYFGVDYGILALLADARERFLKPGGSIIPAEVELSLAPVETSSGRHLVECWRDGSVPEDFSWLATPAANAKHALDLGAENLLSEPATLATLDLGISDDRFLSWEVDVTCSRDGTLDGLLGWFDCQLHGETRMSNSPLAAEKLARPAAFLPLERPVEVREGEPLTATVMVRPADHILAWNVQLRDERFALTTFNSLLLDDDALDRARDDRIARLNQRGLARQVVLSYCDGKRTVAEIETLVGREHPELFPSARAARRFVRRVLSWDTE